MNEYGVNPFVASLTINVVKRSSTKSYINKQGIMLPDTYLSELITSTKLFHTPGVKTVTDNLSNTGLRMFIYLAERLEVGKDVVKLSLSNYKAKTGVKSANTFKAAIRELMKVGVISPTVEKGFYFINPAILFCGSRITAYPDKLHIKRNEDVNQ